MKWLYVWTRKLSIYPYISVYRWLRLDTPGPVGPSLDTPWTEQPDPKAISRLDSERSEIISKAAAGNNKTIIPCTLNK